MKATRFASLITLTVAASLLTACGSSGGSTTSTASTGSGATSGSAAAGGSGVAEAKQIVQAAQNAPDWQGPTQPVDAAAAKGKSVYIINLTQQIPALAEWANTAQSELQNAGLKAEVCDGQGSPNGIITCFQQGIARRPAVIVALALDTTFIHNYIQQANAAGIKVITAQTGTPGIPSGTGAVGEVTFDYPQVGKLLGAYFAASSSCTGYPQIVTSTSSRQPSAAEVSGIQSEIARLCPQVKPLPVQNVLIPDWATKLPTLGRSLLAQNPNLRYIIPLYDGMTIYMVPAIEATGNKQVQVLSFNATPVVMKNELARQSPLTADVGGPNKWFGFALADQVLRAATGSAPVADEKVPLRLFTAENIKSINLNADESTWYGSVDFSCNYHKLWGLPC